MADNKSTKKKTEITEPQVVEHDVDDHDDDLVQEKSPAEREVTETGPLTFTIMVDGEEIELTDHYRKNQLPGAFSMVGNREYAAKYMPILVEKLIGEEQAMWLLAEKDMSNDELQTVAEAWGKARGLKK